MGLKQFWEQLEETQPQPQGKLPDYIPVEEVIRCLLGGLPHGYKSAVQSCASASSHDAGVLTAQGAPTDELFAPYEPEKDESGFVPGSQRDELPEEDWRSVPAHEGPGRRFKYRRFTANDFVQWQGRWHAPPSNYKKKRHGKICLPWHAGDQDFCDMQDHVQQSILEFGEAARSYGQKTFEKPSSVYMPVAYQPLSFSSTGDTDDEVDRAQDPNPASSSKGF